MSRKSKGGKGMGKVGQRRRPYPIKTTTTSYESSDNSPSKWSTITRMSRKTAKMVEETKQDVETLKFAPIFKRLREDLSNLELESNTRTLTSQNRLIRAMKESLTGFIDEISHDSFLFRHIKKKVLKTNCTNAMVPWIKAVTKTLDNTSK